MKTLTLCILCLSLASGETVRQLFENGSYQQETLQDYQAALTHYDRAIEANHPSEDLMVKVYVRAIQCALKLNKKTKASALYEELEQKYGDNTTEQKNRLTFKESLDTNFAFVGELLTSDTNNKELDVQKSEKLQAEGWTLFNKSKFEEGKSLFRKSLQANPSNNDAWNGLGWCFFNLKRSDVAKTAFEKALELNPDNPGALNGLAWIAKNAGNTAEAIAKWNQCIDASPMATAAYSGLVTTYFSQKDYDNAAKYASLWVDADPTSAQAGTSLKNAIAKGGKIPEQSQGFDFLQPAPWGDFEQQRFVLTAQNGTKIGSAVTSISKEENEWVFDGRYLVSAQDMALYFYAQCNRDTFQPSIGRSKMMGKGVNYQYKKKAGKIIAISENRDESHQITLTKPTIDNAQVMDTARRLPFQEGFSTSIDVCHPQTEMIYTCRLSVQSEETVTVIAGNIACYHVLMENYYSGQKVQTVDMWIEKAKPHRIAKADFQTFQMNLVSSTTDPNTKFDTYNGEKFKTKFSTQDGWYVGIDTGRKNAQEVSILSPEMKVKAHFYSKQNRGANAEKVFNNHFNNAVNYFDDYTLREESKTTETYGDYAKINYTADYKNEKDSLVEHRCLYVKDSEIHWLIFRCTKEDYPEVKADIETIINQFHAE